MNDRPAGHFPTAKQVVAVEAAPTVLGGLGELEDHGERDAATYARRATNVPFG